MSIPVICDRCRSTGIAGEADFSHLGDLLDFEPVPVQPRVNGWDPDAQRAFVALLAATGSKRRAATAIGRNTHGLDQLLKRPDSASLKAAIERALAIAKQNGAMKLAQGVADAAARNAQLTPPSRLRGLPSPLAGGGADEPVDEERKLQLLENIAVKFMRKVAAERQARLTGQIVAADFYLRQITFLEVLFDLTASTFGWNAADVMRDMRRAGHSPLDLVSTPFADLLDASRRVWWASEGEPDRPPHPDGRFLTRHESGPWGPRGDEGYSLATDEHLTGTLSPPPPGTEQEEWSKLDHDQQRAAWRRQFDEDAAAQVEWEARAIAEHKQRSANSPGES